MDNIVILKHYLAPLFFSFFIAVAMTFVIQKLAAKFKILDYPSEPRKIQNKPVPLLGGVAIFLTFFIVSLIFYQSGLLADGQIKPQFIIGVWLGGLILMIGGLLDDKYRLKPQWSIIFPILAAILVIFFGLTIGYITNPLGGLLYLGGTIFSPLLIFFWLLGMMYTTKFLDGLDGLASGISVIGFIILFLVSLFWDVPLSGTSILCLILGGSTLGFLTWNFYPAKIFLGEGGSTFLGFMLGTLAIISGAKIATTLLIMGLPILDAVWVILRRIFKEKKSPFLADKKHLHFRLLDAGLNQRQAVLFLYLLTLLFGASAIFQHTFGKLITLGILIIVMMGLGWWVIFRYKSRATFNQQK